MIAFDTLFLLAIAAGFFGSITGLGGGTVMVPVLTYLGVDIKLAIAASMVSVIATSCSSAAVYIREGMANLKTGMFLETFTILGALIGAMVTLISERLVLFIVFGLILIAAGLALFIKESVPAMPATADQQDAFSRSLNLVGCYGDRAERCRITYYPTRAGLGGLLMVFAGMISGLLGIGAGAVNVVVGSLVMGIPTKVFTSTSNMIIGVTALAGSSVYLSAGLIEPTLAIPVILGVALGALIGTVVLLRLTNKEVRRYFIVVVILIGLDMIRRGFT